MCVDYFLLGQTSHQEVHYQWILLRILLCDLNAVQNGLPFLLVVRGSHRADDPSLSNFYHDLLFVLENAEVSSLDRLSKNYLVVEN